ncbi:MAG: outer membrane lipoprotein carrier protein LolA [Neomegalonema sp.]|nr:outer membrane lipoprotein carrier protein LolA [Neomegalonema sp.]
MNRRTLLSSLLGAFLGALVPLAAVANDEDVVRINAYLNSIKTMQGQFVQIAPDGVVSEGDFYIRRPGRLRFEYARPNPTRVIADGFWVAVEDRSLNSQDRFPLSQTPLYLLLKEDVDLLSEGAIQKVERSQGQLRVTAIDPNETEQGSVTMVFDANPVALKQWIVTDPQGLTTTIALRNAKHDLPLDAALFVIEDPRSRE